METPFVVGAYASLPTEIAEQEAFYGALASVPWVNGIEIPFRDAIADDIDWFSAQLHPSFTTNVLTPIPGVMGRVGINPAFGLASPDEAGRTSALEYLIDVVDSLKLLNDAAGRQIITHVALHSAPTRTAEREAFTRSLRTMSQWNLDGAVFVIEHQDAFVAGQDPQKGFLSLKDEIGAVRDSEAENVFLSHNWGRSAIEGRNAETPMEHIRQAGESGLLRGVIFSGAHSQDHPVYGPAWTDSHAPLHRDVAASIMTSAHVTAAAAAARTFGVDYLGAKVTQPSGTVDKRIDVIHNIARAASKAGA